MCYKLKDTSMNWLTQWSIAVEGTVYQWVYSSDVGKHHKGSLKKRDNNSVTLLLGCLSFENISLMSWQEEEDNAFLSRPSFILFIKFNQ